MPVLHEGYNRLFAKHAPHGTEVLLLGDGFRTRYRELAKDVRALSAVRVGAFLRSAEPGWQLRIVEPSDVTSAVHEGSRLGVPRDPTLERVIEDFGLADRARRVVALDVSMRWHSQSALAVDTAPADMTTNDEQAQRFLALAERAAAASEDWWRRVGAVALRDGEVLLTATNEHLPSNRELYYEGDPRAQFRRGEHTDLSTAIHAEAALVARAAAQGLRLQGSQLYVTTFPCPNCARLISQSGFSCVFFRDGYSQLNGAAVLQAAGISLVRVVGRASTDQQQPALFDTSTRS